MDAGPVHAPSAPTAALSRRGLRRHAGILAVSSLALLAAAGIALLGAGPAARWLTGSVTLIALASALLLWRRLRQPVPVDEPAPVHTDLFQQLAGALHEGVLIIDGERIRYANPAAVALLGPQACHDAPPELLSALQAAAGGALGETVLTRHDGQPFKAQLQLPHVDDATRTGRLLVIRDLSELESGRAALATSNAELQAMAGRLFSVQEDERRSISRDLHDDIGQAITAMKLAACAARDEEDTPRRQEDIDQIIELADSTVTRLRNLSMLLRPPQLDALGLEAALRWQAGMLFRSTPVELLMQVDTLSQRPSNEVEQACFRIAQESLTNALRHARASQVSLRLRDGGDGGLHLQVIDDGEGFDLSAPRGLGMIVMRERAQSAGGSLHIDTAPGEGTCINLRLPCSSAAR